MKILTIQEITNKRKNLWAQKHDIALDAEYCQAAVDYILRHAELVREIKRKPQLLIELAFTVVDKDKKTVPFFLNDVQRGFLSYLETRKTNKPIYILKGRQQGFTTLITALQLAHCITLHNFAGFTVADNADNTLAIFNDKARAVYDRLPANLKPREKYNSRRELFFDKLNSSWRIATAADNVGRSRTLNFLHLSEVATFDVSLAALQAGIGEALTKDAIQIYETTANGYNQAKELWDSGTCDNLFFEWWRTAEYIDDDISLADKTSWDKYKWWRDCNAKEKQWLSDRVEWLRAKGLSDNQIAWYVRKFSGYIDKNLIRQEYPCFPEEAFVASGDSVFDRDKVLQRLNEAPEPIKRGYFRYKKRAVDVYETEIYAIEWVDDWAGMISIYEDVKSGYPYVVGGDTAGLGADYFTAQVLDNTTGKQVAVLRVQRIDEDLYADQVYCLGKYYNWALIGLETNFSTVPTRELEQCRYPKLYIRERVDTLTNKITYAHGFETTRKTRPVIIGELVGIFREQPELVVDKATLKEMLAFTIDDSGKPTAPEGEHDDLIMALAIAHYISSQQTTKEPETPREKSFISQHFKIKKDEPTLWR
jgi:hypothetical protein